MEQILADQLKEDYRRSYVGYLFLDILEINDKVRFIKQLDNYNNHNNYS